MLNIKALAATLLVSLTFTASAWALGPVDVSVTADYGSAYIWRGFDIYDGGDAFQPGASASYAPVEPLSLTVGVWASNDMDGSAKYDEIDYYADATYELSMLTISAGYIYYYFPMMDGDDDTAEYYLGVSGDVMDGVSAGLTVYYDYDDAKGYYVSASAEYGRDLSETVSASAGLALGYMTYDEEGMDFSGVSDVVASLGLSADLGAGIGFSASANYAYIPDEDINMEDDEFWTMVGLSYDF